MKITVFQSEKGDCLLVTSRNGKRHILADGGMRPSYQKFVAPAMGKLRDEGETLDLAYVSHIDQDHIAGILQMVDDHFLWRVHDFQTTHGNPTHPTPDSPRPPEVEQLWHNSFHDQLSENAQPIGDLLAATAVILSGVSNEDDLRQVATEQQELVTSIAEAIQLSNRIKADQLGIPMNKPFGGKLAFVRTDQPPPPPIKIGSLEIYVTGPFAEDLDKLRTSWNEWLQDNEKRLDKLRKKARTDAERLGTSDLSALLELRLAQAHELGDRNAVTPPNLASLTLLFVEGGKTLLLTGDAFGDDVVKGLKFNGKLDAEERMHLNTLKVQHHGSENNINEPFVSKITADDYIFCGNGEHENPDLRVLNLIIDSRIKDVPFKATNPQAQGNFKFWFNSSESATKKRDAKTHMKKVKDLIKQRAVESNGRMTFEFLEGDAPTFELNL